MFKYKTPSNTIELLKAFNASPYAPNVGDDAIRDVMTVYDSETGKHDVNFQATVDGLTDWYFIGTSSTGNLIPATVNKLDF